GAPATFEVMVQVFPTVSSGSTISDLATVSESSVDPNATNDSSTVTTTINTQADLSVSKIDTPAPVTAGNNITYTIGVTNNGPSRASSVQVSDPIPTNTTFVSEAHSAAWTCADPAAGGTGTLTCINTAMPVTSDALTLVVRVNPSA